MFAPVCETERPGEVLSMFSVSEREYWNQLQHYALELGITAKMCWCKTDALKRCLKLWDCYLLNTHTCTANTHALKCDYYCFCHVMQCDEVGTRVGMLIESRPDHNTGLIIDVTFMLLETLSTLSDFNQRQDTDWKVMHSVVDVEKKYLFGTIVFLAKLWCGLRLGDWIWLFFRCHWPPCTSCLLLFVWRRYALVDYLI